MFAFVLELDEKITHVLLVHRREWLLAESRYDHKLICIFDYSRDRETFCLLALAEIQDENSVFVHRNSRIRPQTIESG